MKSDGFLMLSVGCSKLLFWLHCSSPHLPAIKVCVVTDSAATGADTSPLVCSIFTAAHRFWTRVEIVLFLFLHVIMHWLLAGCCGLALIHFSGKCKLLQSDLI